MIDLQTYRIRIGYHNILKVSFKGNFEEQSHNTFTSILYILLYAIHMLYFTTIALSLTLKTNSHMTNNHLYHSVNSGYPFLNFVNYSIFEPSQFYFRCLFTPLHVVYSFLFFFGCIHIRHKVLSGKRSTLLFCYSLLVISIIRLLLIVICNTSILNPGPWNPKIIFQNVQGLIPFSELNNPNPSLNNAKILELQSYAYINKPEIIILNETWLKNSINDNEILSEDQYKMFRLDRSESNHPPDRLNPRKFRRNGGGVLIAIRADIDATSKEIKLKAAAELLAVQVTLKNGNKFIFATCYRVGTLGDTHHDAVKSALFSLLKKKNPPRMYLTGDFNLSSANWLNNSSTVSLEQKFIDSFAELGLNQLINEPTHIKGNTLDILLTNFENTIMNVHVKDKNSFCFSDHYPVEFTLKENIRRKKGPKRKFYNFKKADWDSLKNSLSSINWFDLLTKTANVESSYKIFKSTLFSHIEKYIPKVTVKNEFQPPWFDSECYEACREKERLRKKFNNSNNVNDGIKFSVARKDFQKLKKDKMNSNLFDHHDSNDITKKVYGFVKSQSNSCRIPECVSYNDTIRNDPEGQAELFNTFFYDQFSQNSTYNIDIDFSSGPKFDILFSTPIVENLLSKIDPNKAIGPDGLHGKILKNCSNSLAYPLAILYKMSYNSGIIPLEWKEANVVPIFKKGSKTLVENYRPISLTCVVMKVFERIIKDEILVHTKHLIDERQHGFMENRSCTTNMVPFCENLALNLNNNLRTDIIYFDFAKAFDSVNHDRILYKLKHNFGIDGLLLQFICNYLKDRKQSVVLGNYKSSSKDVLSGVPQGSIIGPLLFVLFINDIFEVVSEDTSISLYADDTKICKTIRSKLDMDQLQLDIDNLNTWAITNLMKFHPDKCKVLSVYNSSKSYLENPPSYSLDSVPLENIGVEKDLGVDTASNLSWKHQIDRICSKASQKLGMLRRSCNFLTSNSKRARTIYITIVRSIFEHCSVIWRPTNKTLITKVENVQKRAIKWVLNEENLSYSPKDVYIKKCKDLKILPMALRFELSDLVWLHKILYSLVPIKLPYYFRFYSDNSRLRFCHLDPLSLVCDFIPRTNTSQSKTRNRFANSFFYRTHLLWNQLPLTIRSLESPFEFKAAVKTHLWSKIHNLNYSDSESDPEADM